MDPTKEYHQIFCIYREICDRDPGKHEPYTGSPNSPSPKKARQVKSKVKSMLIIFFDTKGTVQKEFVLASQTVSSAYYCDVLRRLRENVEEFGPKLW
jgi:hypothetical protein